MFAYDDDNHCFVCRQPGSDAEYTAMIGTAWMAELQCIRYRGTDNDVLRRLAELDLRELCDYSPPGDIAPIIRNHVQFTDQGVPPIRSPQQLAQHFEDYLTLLNTKWNRFVTKPIQITEQSAFLEFAWYDNKFHMVMFHTIMDSATDWHIECAVTNELGDRGVGNIVSGWFTHHVSRFGSIKWFTDADWHGAKHWQPTLW